MPLSTGDSCPNPICHNRRHFRRYSRATLCLSHKAGRSRKRRSYPPRKPYARKYFEHIAAIQRDAIRQMLHAPAHAALPL